MVGIKDLMNTATVKDDDLLLVETAEGTRNVKKKDLVPKVGVGVVEPLGRFVRDGSITITLTHSIVNSGYPSKDYSMEVEKYISNDGAYVKLGLSNISSFAMGVGSDSSFTNVHNLQIKNIDGIDLTSAGVGYCYFNDNTNHKEHLLPIYFRSVASTQYDVAFMFICPSSDTGNLFLGNVTVYGLIK